MTKARRRILIIGAIVVTAVAVFLLWPSPIDAADGSFVAPRPGEDGLAPNDDLLRATLIKTSRGPGPEALAVAPDGTLYAGLDSGDVLQISPDGTQTVIANTGGRPLGIKRTEGGRLLVADANKGLLSISMTGEIEVLATEAESVPFGFTNDLDVADDGTVYFTDASDTWGLGLFIYELMEQRPYGRLLRYDPHTRRTDVLARDLFFANGVALAADESYLIVTETFRNRVLRYHLVGERAGELETLIDRLPGYPDNVTRSPRGTFWVAMYAPRKLGLESLLWPRPWLREQIIKLPTAVRPGPKRHGFVLEIDDTGRILRNYQDPTGEHLWSTSSAIEFGDRLYIGCLTCPHVGWIKL